MNDKGYTAVQFGTYNGNDEFYAEIKTKNPSLVVLVEPNGDLNKTINDRYQSLSNIHIENIAIHPDASRDTLTLHKCHAVTSWDLNHVLKHKNAYKSESDIKPFDVPCLSPNQLFEKYSLSSIDLLQIDIEGLDENVILSIDFNKYSIKKLVYEYLHIDNQKVQDFLRSAGYSTFTKDGYNFKCTRDYLN